MRPLVASALPNTERELARESASLSNFARRAVVSLQVLFICTACGSVSQGGGEPDAEPPDAAPGAGNESSDSGLAPDSAAGGTRSAGDGTKGDEAGRSSAQPPGGEAGADAGADAGVCASRFATSVESFTAGPGPTTGQADLPQIVLGPPKGGGTGKGSLDVATLGNGGTITLGFAPSVIVDRPGPDFIVFENPFDVGGDPTKPFAELATVEVSDDGQTFHAFPCTATAYPYGSCAGWHPVLANSDENSIDPTDPTVAGGDAFDLADLGVAEARFVRITDRVDLTGASGTFDLDAVSIVHAECP
jgi:hypothetical protein